MGRNPEIEKILEAWWQLEHCAPPERHAAEGALNQLLDAKVSQSDGLCNREQILDALYPHYKSYRREKRKQEQISVAQSALKKS